jgi:potassium efflux system protein
MNSDLRRRFQRLVRAGIVMTMPVLLITLFSITGHVLASEQPQEDNASKVEQELLAATPTLAEIIPLATQISGRLVILEKKVKNVLDGAAFEKNYAEIEVELNNYTDKLKQLKDLNSNKLRKLVKLKQQIQQQNELLEKNSEPLSKAISQFQTWRKEWLGEKKRWDKWQDSFLKEEALDQLKLTFLKTSSEIDRALNLIRPQLESVLRVQARAGNLQRKIDVITAEVESLTAQSYSLYDESSPMFSSSYIAQFGGGKIWHTMIKGLDELSLPDSRFFAQQGWLIILQFGIFLVVIITVYRKRQSLKDSEQWQFLATRPFSAGLFLGAIATIFVYEYTGAPGEWKLINTGIIGISFARISGSIIKDSWKRHFVYGLVILLIATNLLNIIRFPLPLYRLYILLAALACFFFCLRWAKENARHNGQTHYVRLLRMGSLFFAFIVFAEIGGKHALGLYLFVSFIKSIAAVFVFTLLNYMLHSVLEQQLSNSTLLRTTSQTKVIIRGGTRIIGIGIWIFLLPAVLMIWGAYDNLKGATEGFYAIGFNMGSQRFNLGMLIAAASVVYGSFILSWVLREVLMEEVLIRRKVEKGVRLSMGTLIHYVLIFIGFLLALWALGFKFTNLTIVLSALGVGIGFGLQGVVNNFVSGLILLFEQPVRVGDTIEIGIGGTWAEIKKIGLRSTIVRTVDQADVIIPNADLISNQVTNWTLSNRVARLHLSVGVAYGSDIHLVIETLLACARENSNVAETPAPQALFLNFGDSSLDFELLAWISDAGYRLTTKSELHQEIDRRFRENGIVIPFPQRDVHLDGVQPLEAGLLSDKPATDKNQSSNTLQGEPKD